MVCALLLLVGCWGPSETDDPGSIDGDGDGHSATAGDCDDGDPSVHPGAVEDCDGVDSDCDGVEDPACPVQEYCGNGRDDDQDGLVDCEDGDCAAAAVCVERCEGGEDEDQDGLVDCADDDCLGTEACPVQARARVLEGSGKLKRWERSVVNGYFGSYVDQGWILDLDSVVGVVEVLPLDARWSTATEDAVRQCSFRYASASVVSQPECPWEPDAIKLYRHGLRVGEGCGEVGSSVLPRMLRLEDQQWLAAEPCVDDAGATWLGGEWELVDEEHRDWTSQWYSYDGPGGQGYVPHWAYIQYSRTWFAFSLEDQGVWHETPQP